MQLKFSRFIEGDLDDIADFIAQDNPRRALTFIKEIRLKFSEIESIRSPSSFALILESTHVWHPLEIM